MGRDKDGELMNVTENYGLKKPEKNEYISVDVINENIDAIDTELKKKIDVSGGDTAETIVSDFETSAESFPVPAAKEKAKTGWGKVKKFGEDFKAWMTGVCLLGHIVNNCVTNNPNLPLSAAQGKALMDLYTVLNTKLSGKAAISHASTDGSNGMGNNVYYGHVKLSNEYVIPVGGALEGTAASQHALYNAYSGINNAVIAINDHIKNHFYGTAIIDASVDKKGFNYTLGLDNTYIVTCTKGTNENETAVWILNTRNNTIVVTTLKSVSGISYMRAIWFLVSTATRGLLENLVASKCHKSMI